MSHDEFVKRMNEPVTMTDEELYDICLRSMSSETSIMKCIVAMEELAELQKEISKAARGELNRYNLIQELADVEICMYMISKIYGITDEELDKAERIKLGQEKERLNTK